MHLQENVFVGASAIILKGVTVGRNSVVASGAVVTRDVPSDCIVAGSPARTIRRFIAVEGPPSVEVSSHR